MTIHYPTTLLRYLKPSMPPNTTSDVWTTGSSETSTTWGSAFIDNIATANRLRDVELESAIIEAEQNLIRRRHNSTLARLREDPFLDDSRPKKKEESPDAILIRRVKTAIRSGAKVPVTMGDKYCELIKRERHLNREERRYFNHVKEDKVKMCDVVVEDIA